MIDLEYEFSKALVKVFKKRIFRYPLYIVVFFLIFFGYLHPYVGTDNILFKKSDSVKNFESSSQKLYENLLQSKTVSPGKTIAITTDKIAYNMFVIIDVEILMQGVETGNILIFKYSNPTLIRRNIAILIAILLIGVIVFEGAGPLFFQSWLLELFPGEEPEKVWLNNFDRSEERLMAEGIIDIKKRANSLFMMSNIMLVTGILMAGVGVAIFYVSIIDFSTDVKIEKIIWYGIRSFGILFFIEAIAWFLLRQFRSLIEDFKRFYQIQEKRSNYLIVLKLFSNQEITPYQYHWGLSLIQEDTSGKLKEGETTEYIENIKNIDSNFSLEVLKNIQNISKPKESSDSKKDDKEKK